MFQPWFVEFVRVLSDIVVGLSAAAVAIAGVSGLYQWRAELKGRTKYELACRMVILAFQFRDEYKRARNPFTFPGESAD